MNKDLYLYPKDWDDYELLDTGNGKKLEKYSNFYLIRPCPQARWSQSSNQLLWQKADAIYIKKKGSKGYWKINNKIPDEIKIHHHDLVANIYLSAFMHTGVFPEQLMHWKWMQNLIKNLRDHQLQYEPHVLNLFAYTGMASVACAKMGAKVTHVDSSRSAIGWAKKNQLNSGLDSRSIRWILDDVLTFVIREIKRGVKYDAIIMDPPAYGHGKKGEVWNFNKSFPKLLSICKEILVEDPLFILINAYAVKISKQQLEDMLKDLVKKDNENFTTGELIIKPSKSNKNLSTGIFTRYEKIFTNN